MATTSQYIQLAKALPPRLQRFFARYPPASIINPAASGELPQTAYQIEAPNPFLATKHPVTGKWHDPKFSLRRQAELVKLAREHGVEELLPYTPKKTEERIRHRVEHGLRVKGTGIGQQVKGHAHERHLVGKYVLLLCLLGEQLLLTFVFRMEKRRQAMLNMPKLIREWKAVSQIAKFFPPGTVN